MSKPVTKESNLAKFIRFGTYLTALVPLLVFRDLISPFHFGKVVIFWAFLFFTLAFTVTTLTSVLKYPSFWGTLERMGGLWTFWHYFVFYIILTSVLIKKEHWQSLFKFMAIVGVLSALYGF